MAKRQFIPALLLGFGPVLVAVVHAELPKESRDSAAYILTGTVSKVFTRNGGASTEYAIQIQIEEMEKGEGFEDDGFI